MIYILVFILGAAAGAFSALVMHGKHRKQAPEQLDPMTEEEQRVIRERLEQWDNMLNYTGPKR